MRKIILHSDQIMPASFAMDKAIFGFVKERPVRIAYVASKTDPLRKYFKPKREYYAQLGIADVAYFDFDREFRRAQYEEMANYHVFHLAGGDTNYFLTSLRKTCGLRFLRENVSAGKVLVGVSAGAIIAGADIRICSVFNESIEQDPTGLSLFDFEFFPHYCDCEGTNCKLRRYSMDSHRKIYACADGNGLVLDDAKIRFFGGAMCFDNGLTTPVMPGGGDD